MNKSLVTNLVAVSLIPLGHVSPVLGPNILSVGLFATSGAITNWLAIHMLFEKVPGLYGSGVIPSRFEEFKLGIRQLIMGQFFTHENLARFMGRGEGDEGVGIDGERLADAVDYDHVFQRLTEAIMDSSFGGMLGMFGGPSALEPLRDKFSHTMRGVVVDLAGSEKVNEAIKSGLAEGTARDALIDRVEGIVQSRLDELTPRMVKEIVQEMIQQHLGWLVVWGGVFGGLIGLVTSLVS